MVLGLEVYGNQADTGSGIYYNDFIGHLEDLYIHDNLGTGMVVYNGEVDGIGPTIEYSSSRTTRAQGSPSTPESCFATAPSSAMAPRAPG